MAEKTDEEIINEVGLESSSNDISPEEALEELSIKDDKGELENLEPVKDDSSDNKDKSSENVIENEDRDDEKELINNADKELKEESLSVQKKQPRIYKILIGVAAFLLLTLLTGAVLYFTGFFDPEPVKPEQKIEKKVQNEIIFDEDSINKNKLNKKLTMLTKKEIMNKEELEAEEKRLKEEERLKKEAEEKAIEEKKRKEAERLAKMQEEKRLLKEQEERLKKEQEALLQMQDELKIEFEEQKKQFLLDLENQKAQIEEKEKEEIETIINEEPEMNVEPVEEMPVDDTSKTFLSFINVATIKGELYKSFLDKALTFDKNVSLCRDFKNRIEIYFGPYESKKERKKVFNNLIENGFKESYLVDFTQEEYDKRCKY